ncbi:hypothetical protein P167DRAFT_544645 [Morchella conica CCBAS932]|uniref:Prokaryotic-type class I peptide chain release factors domain-containing protein n=1 Tax=Morchella conica CCBAS932 TaxID=1392247 RepID=A0A3N4KS02_9PEZI|nr:hypothetical protein P167DRAFT_544645 [Morchella conica CCBAS932]
MPPRPSVIEDEIVEVFLKGSGPGGQKINKTASAVQLKHLPTGLVVKSQATRSREQNRKIARNILAMKLDERFNGAESRHAKLVEKAQKKKASLLINLCRYAKLDSEKNTINCETMEREMNDDLENDEEHPLDANIASPPQYVSEDTPEALDETDEAITGSEKSPEATSDCQRIGSIN